MLDAGHNDRAFFHTPKRYATIMHVSVGLVGLFL